MVGPCHHLSRTNFVYHFKTTLHSSCSIALCESKTKDNVPDLFSGTLKERRFKNWTNDHSCRSLCLQSQLRLTSAFSKESGGGGGHASLLAAILIQDAGTMKHGIAISENVNSQSLKYRNALYTRPREISLCFISALTVMYMKN